MLNYLKGMLWTCLSVSKAAGQAVSHSRPTLKYANCSDSAKEKGNLAKRILGFPPVNGNSTLDKFNISEPSHLTFL